MAQNLSSNQQYLLSMVQQNNPEFYSKLLNEDAPQPKSGRKNQQAPSPVPSAPKQDTVNYDPTESQNRENSRQNKASEHYKEVIGSLPSDPSKLSAKQAAEVAMYRIMSKSGPGSEKLKSDVEGELGDRNYEIVDKLQSISDNALRSRSVTTGENNSPSTQSKVALRYQKKYDENQLPLGDRPISPFYKTTRNQFRDEFGRDFDTSGRATPANMRGLVNIKTNLSGRLNDIETGWQDKMSWEAQLNAAEKNRGNLPAMLTSTLAAKRKAEEDNPVYDYRASDFDVPEVGNPAEQKGMGRTLPTKPVDTKRTTEWVFGGNEGIMGGNNNQASNLTGKSVNQRINRIA
jgi:hypothetical protein